MISLSWNPGTAHLDIVVYRFVGLWKDGTAEDMLRSIRIQQNPYYRFKKIVRPVKHRIRRWFVNNLSCTPYRPLNIPGFDYYGGEDTEVDDGILGEFYVEYMDFPVCTRLARKYVSRYNYQRQIVRDFYDEDRDNRFRTRLARNYGPRDKYQQQILRDNAVFISAIRRYLQMGGDPNAVATFRYAIYRYEKGLTKKVNGVRHVVHEYYEEWTRKCPRLEIQAPLPCLLFQLCCDYPHVWPQDHRETFELLVKAGASYNVEYNDGRPLLSSICAKHGEDVVVDVLIKHGTEIQHEYFPHFTDLSHVFRLVLSATGQGFFETNSRLLLYVASNQEYRI